MVRVVVVGGSLGGSGGGAVSSLVRTFWYCKDSAVRNFAAFARIREVTVSIAIGNPVVGRLMQYETYVKTWV